MTPFIWLRAETKKNESRSVLAPQDVECLIDAGFQVTVERSRQRIFKDSDFQAAGAVLAEPESWDRAPEEAFILGLKELPESDSPIRHRHIYFAHAYKEQSGWEALMT